MLNAFAAAIVLLGGLVELPAGVGLLSGATTNTPSLAAAQQALKQAGVTDAAAVVQGLAYAVAYATVYPLVMLLRVFSTQLIVFLFYQVAGG